MNEFSLNGKAALVTGGGRGIGRAISLALAQAGADVAIFYRSREDEANETADAIRGLGRRACAVRQDMGDLSGLVQAFEKTLAALGKVDILVNNAGVADLVPFSRVTQELMERTLRVNVSGPFFLAQAAARHMINRGQGGRIVNITSTNGFVAEALLAPYNASKGAMEMLTKSLAIELGPHQITVNSVAPGLVETEIGLDFPLKPEFWQYAKEHIPLGRLAKPEHVAGAVVYLASDSASYITGQHIIVDGGLIADQFPRMQFYTEPR
ncbi:MAG: glucose 1-dehydrogenase [Planctomycetes bacterium]|nr:glucose 1-dehydrogenase [Planctomycetota bacterium]